jgi:hypothetical protein
MLIGRSLPSQPAFSGTAAVHAFRLPALPRPRAAGTGRHKIPGDHACPERPRQAQRSRKRPAPLCSLKAFLAGMQVRTPASMSRQRVGNNLIPGRHQAKQVRLGRADSASNTHPDRWRGPDRTQGPPGHSATKPTAPARRQHRAPYPARRLARTRAPPLPGPARAPRPPAGPRRPRPAPSRRPPLVPPLVPPSPGPA